MPPPSSEQTIRAYAATIARLRARIETYVARAWDTLGDWRDPDIERFVDLVAPVILAGQRTVASLTDAYLARLAGILEVPTGTLGIPESMFAGLRGPDVYRRPAVQMRTALSDGSTFTDALGQGRIRALSLAATDLQLAKTHAARHRLRADPKVVGYRRVLTGNKSCGLCVVASTQRYHRRALLPIHPGCDCAVAPIYGKHDPGRVINRGRLEGAREQIAERFGPDADLRNAVVVHEHGELGPVLARAGDSFTGPDDF